MSTLKLQGNRLLIQQKPPVCQTPGGIYLPEKSHEPRNVGTVLAVGDNVVPELVGKEIMFRLESAQNFSFEQTQGKLIFVTDIIATL